MILPCNKNVERKVSPLQLTVKTNFLAESSSQGGSDFVQSLVTWLLEHVWKIVNHSIVAGGPHRDVGLYQACRIRFSLITQGIIQ